MLEASMQNRESSNVKLPSPAIIDSAKVRTGGWFPSLPVRDIPATVKDGGKVRTGGWFPSLPVR